MADWPYLTPFDRDETWHGHLISEDGTATDDFVEDDVAAVLYSGQSSENGWDGIVAAVFVLKDGRFVSYETFWEPTGDGFSEDAYGGDADLHFGASIEEVIRLGLTDEGRTLCGLSNEVQPNQQVEAS